MMKILIVEDEDAIAALLQMNLERAGYHCQRVDDGEKACDLLDETSFDLILLDVMLPKADGYEVMEYIEPLQIPVIFLTAKGSVKDKVKGLSLGADDYLVKPFEIAELLARVESVLRRYHKGEKGIMIGDVHIDPIAMKVIRQGQDIILTNKEFELLMLFVRNKNIALYRETIYDKLWGDEVSDATRTLDLHVQRLRKKLGWQDRIRTVFKIGYRLEVENEVK